MMLPDRKSCPRETIFDDKTICHRRYFLFPISIPSLDCIYRIATQSPDNVVVAMNERLRPTPLVLRNRAGCLYERTQEVEEQIASVLHLDAVSLLKRLRIHDRYAPHFIREEVIVYLIREYLLKRDDSIVPALFEILFRRCSKSIMDRLSLEPVLAETAYNEVVGDIVNSILDTSDDRSDYLQVRFWSAITRRTVDAYKKYKLEQDVRYRESEVNDNGEAGAYDIEGRIADTARSAEDRCIYREALAEIPEPIRTAFVLHYFYDWQIESDDPDEPTISGRFGKTPRTINNWLNKAADILRQWRNEKER